MAMLHELIYIKQHQGEPQRRWFEDENFDLIIWVDETDEIIEFELCYDKDGKQRAIRWEKPASYAHYHVDDGDKTGRMKATPVLIPMILNDSFHYGKIAALFKLASKELNERIANFVYDKIMLYPAGAGHQD
jgi:hypothetical protein